MLLRSIALSIALLIGLGTIIPIATEYAEAGAKKKKTYKKKRQWRGVKPYSKRWWQLYRAQERRKKQRAQQTRTLRLRQARLAKAREAAEAGQQMEVAAVETNQPQTKNVKAILPSGNPAPENWRQAGAADGELKFDVKNGESKLGSASIAVVGPATGETNTVGRNRTLGGVPTTSLRREVINQMVRENGWVVNDYQKEVGGKQVYVVVAQSQGSGGNVQSRMFYFTESEGRIYSVATNASNDSAETLAMESEKMIHSLHGTSRQMQQAAVKGFIRERVVADHPVQQNLPQQPTQLMPCAPYVPPQK